MLSVIIDIWLHMVHIHDHFVALLRIIMNVDILSTAGMCMLLFTFA